MQQGSAGNYLYDQVSQAISKRIADGTYRAGDRIPSIGDLSAEFGLSSITIRRAIKELVSEGLLISRHGQGNFVRDRRKIIREIGPRIDGLHDLASDIRRAGFEPGVHLIDLRLEVADDRVATQLKVPSGSAVYLMDSLILADHVPIARDLCFLPPEIRDRFKDRIGSAFVVSLLLEAGTRIRNMELMIESFGASEAVRFDLDVPKGFPLLTIGYTPIGEDGRPLLTGSFTSRSDRLAYRIKR